MPQLTMKELDERLSALETEVEAQGATLVSTTVLSGNTALSVLVTDETPEWGLEIIRGVIQALHAVRLQSAQEYALALEAKYFPSESEFDSDSDVEEEDEPKSSAVVV